MNIEEIDIKDIEFGEPIEEREPNYRDGYIRGIYRARNIIDSKQKEIERLNQYIGFYKDLTERQNKDLERLNNIINELEKDLEEKIDEDRLNILSNSHWKYVLDKLQELKGSYSNEQ